MRNDILLIIKNTLEEEKDLTILSMYAEDDTVFGVYINDVEKSLSFLSLPEYHIETTIDNINIQFFELGAILNHIYFNGALKFWDILYSSDNIIDHISIFDELCDFIAEHLPFNIAKLKLIEAINKVNDYQYDNEDDISALMYLRDRIINFWVNLLVHSDEDLNELEIIIGEIEDKNDFISLCNNFNKFKQNLNELSFSKISEKDMNIINNMYVEIQIRYLKV